MKGFIQIFNLSGNIVWLKTADISTIEEIKETGEVKISAGMNLFFTKGTAKDIVEKMHKSILRGIN